MTTTYDRRPALAPTFAHGPPPLAGVLRSVPADFAVDELPGFEPDGGSGHMLIHVEKTDANTLHVARALARFAGVRAADVGFAGLKDRRAVATQWFTVPRRREVDWAGLAGEGFRVLAAHPHSRKLRRGALAGNRFRIVVREVAGDLDDLPRRMEALRRDGVPNYFGPQRFGRDASNIDRVTAWVDGGELPRGREERSFMLSAARALAFNAVLDARVRDGSWNRLLDGEIVNLAGSGSVFAAGQVDAELAWRCAALDLHPTGPLPGRGGRVPVATAGAVESAALAPYAQLVARLVEAGVDASRRALRLPVAGLSWSLDGRTLVMDFRLPRGAFATAVLAEVVVGAAAALPEPAED